VYSTIWQPECVVSVQYACLGTCVTASCSLLAVGTYCSGYLPQRKCTWHHCWGVRVWVVYLTPKIERVISLLSASPVGEARCRCRKVWLTRIDYYYYGIIVPEHGVHFVCTTWPAMHMAVIHLSRIRHTYQPLGLFNSDAYVVQHWCKEMPRTLFIKGLANRRPGTTSITAGKQTETVYVRSLAWFWLSLNYLLRRCCCYRKPAGAWGLPAFQWSLV
jgi:hypothetical protein